LKDKGERKRWDWIHSIENRFREQKFFLTKCWPEEERKKNGKKIKLLKSVKKLSKMLLFPPDKKVLSLFLLSFSLFLFIYGTVYALFTISITIHLFVSMSTLIPCQCDQIG
jgi:hypothetical protein